MSFDSLSEDSRKQLVRVLAADCELKRSYKTRRSQESACGNVHKIFSNQVDVLALGAESKPTNFVITPGTSFSFTIKQGTSFFFF